MQAQILKTIETNWVAISQYFTFPTNEVEYQKTVELMDNLLEMDYPDDHPVFTLINLLGEMIDRYEMKNFSSISKLEEMSDF